MQRQLRLRHRTDFNRLRAEGKAFKHALLTLSLRANDLPHNRYGMIISKRMGKAVVRNRLRRQLRACWRAIHPQLEQGYDMVIIPRPLILNSDYQAQYAALSEVLQRANVMKRIP